MALRTGAGIVSAAASPAAVLRPRFASVGLQTEDDEAESCFGSPVARVEGTLENSPSIRPLAPKESFYKSPPPLVSDRLARVEKRQRQAENITSSAGLTFRELGDVADLFFAPGEEPASRTTTATEEFRDGSPTAPADDFLLATAYSLHAARTTSRLSDRSLTSSLSSNGRRAGETDTPPAGPHAFEAMETLVKCPAPKRARTTATLRADAMEPRRLTRFSFEADLD